MSETIIASLTLESLREELQRAGYRVETPTDPVANLQYLRSATAGIRPIRSATSLDTPRRSTVCPPGRGPGAISTTVGANPNRRSQKASAGPAMPPPEISTVFISLSPFD